MFWSAKKLQLMTLNCECAHCLFTVLRERKWLEVVVSKNEVAIARIKAAGG